MGLTTDPQVHSVMRHRSVDAASIAANHRPKRHTGAITEPER